MHYTNYIPYDLYRIVKWMAAGTVLAWVFGFMVGQLGDEPYIFLFGLIVGPFSGWLVLAPIYYMFKLAPEERAYRESRKEQIEATQRFYRELDEEMREKRRLADERVRLKNIEAEREAKLRNDAARERERKEQVERDIRNGKRRVR